MSVDIQNCVPVTPTPLEKVKEKATKVGAWIWEHKKWVVLSVVTTAGVIVVVKKRTAIKELFQSRHIEELTAKSAVNAITEENNEAPDKTSGRVLKVRSSIKRKTNPDNAQY